MPEYSELLKLRRSIRDYEAKEVSLDTVKEIIGESCIAPSSGNGQPWRFIIVNNREVIKKLSDESKGNLLAEMERNPASPSRNYEGALRDESFNVFYNAPCLVFIGGDRALLSLQVDCALAASYFMFSACERGLGTCWIGLGRFINDPELRKFIGMPAEYQIVAPVILGYPSTSPVEAVRMEPQILKVVS